MFREFKQNLGKINKKEMVKGGRGRVEGRGVNTVKPQQITKGTEETVVKTNTFI